MIQPVDTHDSRIADVAVVIGMPRAGTTWLYENLKTHPEICASNFKEINRYLRAISDDSYLKYFKGIPGRIMLDISPAYFFDLDAIREIANNHRFVILIVREPQAWIQSLAAHVRKYAPHSDAIGPGGKFTMLVDRKRSLVFDHAAYDHARHLAAIRKIVGDKLLEIEFAELEQSPVEVLRKIESYLGVTHYFRIENTVLEKVNSRDARIAPIYAIFMRAGIVNAAAFIASRLLPRRVIHWLRRRLVYGR